MHITQGAWLLHRMINMYIHVREHTYDACGAQIEENEGSSCGSLAIQHPEILATLNDILKDRRKFRCRMTLINAG